MAKTLVQKCAARVLKTTNGEMTPEAAATIVDRMAKKLLDPAMPAFEKLEHIKELNGTVAESLSDYALQRTNAISNVAKHVELYALHKQDWDAKLASVEPLRAKDPTAYPKRVNELVQDWGQQIKSVAADGLFQNMDNFVYADKAGTHGAILQDAQLLLPHLRNIMNQSLEHPFAKGLWKDVMKPLITHANELGNILRERPEAIFNARWFDPSKVRGVDREYFIGRIVQESHGDLAKAVRDMGGAIRENEAPIDAFRRVAGGYYDRISDSENLYHNGLKLEHLNDNSIPLDEALQNKAMAGLSPQEIRPSQRPESVYHLPYADADAFFRLFHEFGDGDVTGTFWRELKGLNHFNATYEVLGAHPEALFQTLMADVAHGASDVEKDILQRNPANRGLRPDQMLQSARDMFLIPAAQQVFDHVTRIADIPRSVKLAEVAGILQKTFGTLSLQGSALAQLSDIPVRYAVLTHMGAPHVETFIESHFGTLFNMVPGREKQAMLSAVSAGMRGYTNDVLERLGMDWTRFPDMGVSKKYNALLDGLYSLTGIRAIDNGAKNAMLVVLGRTMGEYADHSWQELSQFGDMRNFWEAMGMNEKLWEGVRPHARESAGFDVPGKFIFAEDVLDRDARIGLRQMLDKTLDTAIPTPNSIQRATLTWGTQAGTWSGTLMRLLGQFMSFPLTIQQRVMPMIQGNAGTGALLGYGMTSLMYGVAGLWIKDLLNNRTPTRIDRPDGMVAAMRQSGFAPVYTNLLASSLATRSPYEGPLRDYEGPTIRAIDRMTGLGASWLTYGKEALQDQMAGQASERTSPGLSSLRAARDYLPFSGLPLVKGAVDNLFMYHLYDAMDPGWTERYQRQLEQRGQAPLFPISPQQ